MRIVDVLHVARRGAAREHEPAEPVAELAGHLGGDGATERPTVHHRAIEPEMIDETDDVGGDRRDRRVREVLVGRATAAVVERDDLVSGVEQHRQDRVPHPAGHPPTVDEHHGRA